MHQSFEFIPWATGGLASIATILASVDVNAANGGGWLPVIVQAGMAGIVILLVVKHIPGLIAAQQEMQKSQHEKEKEMQKAYLDALEKQGAAHRESLSAERQFHQDVINQIVKSNSEKDDVWQRLVAQRGYCPVRDNGNNFAGHNTLEDKAQH